MSKIAMKKSLTVKGIVDLDESKINVEVEGRVEPINLSTLIEDFNGEEVTISINMTNEIA